MKKRVIFDFEFVPGNPCLPISMAMVNVDTGESAYLQWPQAYERANASEWLAQNVAPYLIAEAACVESEIEEFLREFLSVPSRDDLTLYAECGAYDFFLLSETLGGFSRSGLPYTYHELTHMNLPYMEKGPDEAEHFPLDEVLRARRALLLSEGR